MASISEALAIAVQHHQAGRQQVAERIYRQILAVNPDHADTLHLLGVIASQMCNHELAVEYISRAIELSTTEPAFHNNLGKVLQSQGKSAQAVASHRRAVQLKPDYAAGHYNLGVALQAEGQLDEAVRSYQRALELEPITWEAHSNLGNVFRDQGKLDEAVASYERALTLKPESAETHHGLGVALHAQDKLDEAVACFHRALRLNAESVEVHFNLGVALQAQGKLDDAIESYYRVLDLKPNYAEAHNNLGTIFKNQGNLSEAIVAYRRALDLNPRLAEVHNNLGNVFKDQGKLVEAIIAYQRSLELEPEYSEAHYNLGTALQAQGKLDEAAASYRRSLELRPSCVEAHINLGIAMHIQGCLNEAIACFQRALQLNSDHAEAHNSLGNVLKDQGHLDLAIASYRRALELNSDFLAAYNNLGIALHIRGNLDEAVTCFLRVLESTPADAEALSNLGTVFKDQGKLDEAVACHRLALEQSPENVAIHSSLLYTLGFCPHYDSSTIYGEHRRWSQVWAQPLAKEIVEHRNEISPNRRLRIGYVSPDFRNHCQSLFTAPLFSAHDHRHFEIVCYSDVVRPDGFTDLLRSRASRWRTIVGLPDEEVARLVRQDQIDILVDLTMHMAGGRPLLFARKPAPVQVCWLAYPGTTGNSAIDYRLTDPFLDPPGLVDQHYVEKSVLLADTFWCYDPLSFEPPVNLLPALATGYVTFGSLNNFCKVNAGILKLWAQVLLAVDGSRLMLLAPEGAPRARVLDDFEREGIRGERIVFASHRPRPQYLELYHHIDIGLDTLPYNGHTTSLDSLWMGVPVVTIVGQTVMGRAGLSQLSNLRLTEFVAQSPNEFVRIAAEATGNLKRLSELRGSLRGRMERSPLMDAPRFARSIETAYRTMWQGWCARAVSSHTAGVSSSGPRD